MKGKKKCIKPGKRQRQRRAFKKRQEEIRELAHLPPLPETPPSPPPPLPVPVKEKRVFNSDCQLCGEYEFCYRCQALQAPLFLDGYTIPKIEVPSYLQDRRRVQREQCTFREVKVNVQDEFLRHYSGRISKRIRRQLRDLFVGRRTR